MARIKIKDSGDWTFKEKLGFTILMLFIYRVGVMIPLPFVDPNAFEAALSTGAGSSIFAAMTMVGGSLTQLGLFSLGVMPYITASIIFQLLKVAIPKLKEMSEDPIEQKKITQWTRYLTILMALFQGAGIVVGAPQLLGVQVFTSTGPMTMILAIFTMVVGAIIVMKIGEEITMRGVSNGQSLIIFTSILASIPGLMNSSLVAKGWGGFIGFALILLLVLSVVSFVEKSEYPITIVYAKSVMRAQTNHNKLPIKVAIAGVLPVIFASAFVSIPVILEDFVKVPWVLTLAGWFHHGEPLYVIAFALLTIGMTYFSVQLVFDVDQIARQIKEQGGFVAGKRPGRETKEFISYIAYRMAGLDAIYLVAISFVSLFLFPLVGVPEGAFGATSIIILCTVVVTLLQVIDTETSAKNIKASSLFATEQPTKKKRLFSKDSSTSKAKLSKRGKKKESELEGIFS